MLRGMVKSRRESIALYRQGNRPELAAKEEAEIGVIESFLPQPMGEGEIAEAVDAAVAETGARRRPRTWAGSWARCAPGTGRRSTWAGPGRS